MNGLIKLDSNLESIKTARMYFHCISITASILGVLLWSISPFVMNGKKPLIIFGRYATLFFTNLSGISLLVSANYLKKTNYIIKASEKATENIYINQIANTQLIQRKYYENLSMQLPDILASQEINNSGLLTTQYENDHIQLMPELPENLIPLFNIACEKGQLSLRDIKRKYKDLDNDTALDMLSQMEKLGYGQIEKKGLSIKFIPKMD